MLFVQAAVENLPLELDGLAQKVYVQFPWGSLLRIVANGEIELLERIRRICAANAVLEVITGLDAQRDVSEITRLGIFLPSTAMLIAKYQEAGFEITKHTELNSDDWTHLQTTWGRRLRGRASRTLTFLSARAI